MFFGAGAISRFCFVADMRVRVSHHAGYLNRDGTVFNACKGGNYKGMYHVSRCLLYCFQVVEKMIE